MKAAFAEFRRLDGLLSHYSDSSEVGRLNREGRLAAPSPELEANLRKSLEFGRLSGGAFDITVQPILELYERSFRELKRAPSDAEVLLTLRLVDYRRISLEEGEVRLSPGQRITLGGIAKGYAVDRALTVLQARGLRNALVDAGGDIRAMGRAEGRRDWLHRPAQPARTGRVHHPHSGHGPWGPLLSTPTPWPLPCSCSAWKRG